MDKDTETSVMLLLGRMEGKLDAALTQQAAHAVAIQEIQKEVSQVSNGLSRLRGAGVVLGILFTGAVAWVTKHIA